MNGSGLTEVTELPKNYSNIQKPEIVMPWIQNPAEALNKLARGPVVKKLEPLKKTIVNLTNGESSAEKAFVGCYPSWATFKPKFPEPT